MISITTKQIIAQIHIQTPIKFSKVYLRFCISNIISLSWRSNSRSSMMLLFRHELSIFFLPTQFSSYPAQ